MSSSANTPRIIELDIAILGGGIAGLWLINRLQQRGYDAALFESEALGSGQTLASQGMIHGGMKYTLAGALSGASEAIADMPRHWRQCLCGEGDVDLRGTRILSDHFYLWSGASASSRLTGFFASKLIRGRVEPVGDYLRPSLLRHSQFEGSLYKISDMVLDVPSLIADLAHAVTDRLFLYNTGQASWHKQDGKLELRLRIDDTELWIRANRFIWTAGEGNDDLLHAAGITQPAMQRRPLQQVMVKHRHQHRFYGHCLGTGSTPRLTISSHPMADGSLVWYLGGSLAEEGASQDAETVIGHARDELASLMPWLDFSDAEWATLPVTRAEPRQAGLARPDNAFAERAPEVDNLIVAWPTKLTLAPNMANQVIDLLDQDTLVPEHLGQIATRELRRWLPEPPLACTPWELAFPLPPFTLPEDDDEDETTGQD